MYLCQNQGQGKAGDRHDALLYHLKYGNFTISKVATFLEEEKHSWVIEHIRT